MAATFVNPLFAGGPEVRDMIERATRAAQRARQRRSSWQAYARMLTRNPKLRIEFTSTTPCTDGVTIWLRVPIELGDDVPHEKKNCGERDSVTRVMKCPMCRILDRVDTTMYHEVAHITAESFVAMDDSEKRQLVIDAVRMEAAGNPASKRIVKIEDRIKLERPLTFVEASNLVSPWLGICLNAVEDARVNEYQRQARPGTKVMFQAQTWEVFEHGIERPDGTVARWSEQPVNMQVLIGVYCRISGLDTGPWLAPEVNEALDDDELTDLCFRARTARSVGNTFRLSIRILERLRKLGFCLAPDDEEDDPEPQDTQPKDDAEESDEKPEKGDESEDDTKGEGAGEGAEADPDDDEAEEAEGSSGGDEESDDEGDESESEGGGGGAEDEESEDDGTDGEGDEGGDDDESDSNGGESASGGASTEDGESEAPSTPTGADDDGEEEGEVEDDLSNPEYKGDDGSDPAPAPEPYTQDDLERDGKPEDVEAGLQQFGRHEADGSIDSGDTADEAEAVNRAIIQGEYFDAPSLNVWSVQVNTDGESGRAWERYSRGAPIIKIEEKVLGPALLRLRRALEDNRKGSYERNLKRGSIDASRLGSKVLTDKVDWFRHKTQPGKKDYFVLIGLDVSGSTGRPGVIRLIKEAAMAQAELCQRLGIKFGVYAHSGDHEAGGLVLDVYQVKSPDQAWDAKAKQRLTDLQPAAYNLDGHTLEFYRKVCDGQSETDKLIMYYTDGAMPLENFAEELDILQREIRNCRNKRYTLVGVGVRNDDPTKHGLDTIRIDQIEDVPKLVDGLRTRLAK